MWSCRTTAAKRAGGWTFYHADVAGILAHPYVAECDAALTRTMHEEIVRDRRISVDAAWLGRNELLKRIFSPAAEWRELSDYLLGVIAAVARQPYEGDDARQRVEFLAVIAEQVTKLRNSLDECDIELATRGVYLAAAPPICRRCASPSRANRWRGFRSWVFWRPAMSISRTSSFSR